MALTKVSTPGIKDEAITLAKLLHGDSNNNGKFLRANNGADPTFETVNTDLVADTSPQLGGDLQSNGNDIDFADNDKAIFGTSGNLEIYSTGSESLIHENATGNLKIKGTNLRLADSSDNLYMFMTSGAGIEMYFNASKKFETQLGGTLTTGNLTSNLASGTAGQGQLNLGSSGAPFIRGFDTGNHGSGSKLELISGDGDDHIVCKRNAAVEIFHDASKKFETASGGALVTGVLGVGLSPTIDTNHNSTYALQLSAASQCLLSIFRTQDGTTAGSNGVLMGLDGSYHYLVGKESRPFRIGTNGSSKIEITTNGDFVPINNNARDLGSSSLRWRNIYTNDLNLSNKGSSNDVDSTWGDWTIQEGESDLFLKNNRSGKKYKFNLTEVS